MCRGGLRGKRVQTCIGEVEQSQRAAGERAGGEVYGCTAMLMRWGAWVVPADVTCTHRSSASRIAGNFYAELEQDSLLPTLTAELPLTMYCLLLTY